MVDIAAADPAREGACGPAAKPLRTIAHAQRCYEGDPALPLFRSRRTITDHDRQMVLGCEAEWILVQRVTEQAIKIRKDCDVRSHVVSECVEGGWLMPGT